MNYSLKPIYVDLRASRTLASLLGVGCLGACAPVVILPLPVWLAWLVILTAVLATTHALALYALLLRPSSVVRIEVTVTGEMRCMMRSGEMVAATVLGSSTVMPWLTLLNLQLPGRRLARHVILLPHALDADEFRRLRVWLRWGSQALPKEVRSFLAHCLARCSGR
jgi:toxin CptA